MKALWGQIDGINFSIDYVDKKYIIFVEGEKIGYDELIKMDTNMTLVKFLNERINYVCIW